jgi:ceramide glucosyltransferase
VIYALWVLAAAAGVYQLLALAAALRQWRRRDPEPSEFPPVSILKPVRGLDPQFYEAILSHARLDYPEFEILFGVSDPADPALPEIHKLIAAFPERAIRVVMTAPRTANGKVGSLAELAAAARHPVLVVNDSDIRVPVDYLRRVVAPLEDQGVGLVTCLYRARASSLAGSFEAAGIATDFAPGVLVAPLAGVSGFALGSTMAFRAGDLARIGGFGVLGDYIADDYQLGCRIAALGRRVHLARLVVETSLSDRSWADVWRHQLRWARTIRAERGGGYLGLPVSNATLWSVALAAAGAWQPAAALLALRLAAGLAAGVLALGDRALLLRWPLIPFRDLAGVALWAAGLFGSTVLWRGVRLRLLPGGRIAPE